MNKDDFRFHDGYMLPPTKPGLGVEVNEEMVIERSRNAPDWRNPVCVITSYSIHYTKLYEKLAVGPIRSNLPIWSLPVAQSWGRCCTGCCLFFGIV